VNPSGAAPAAPTAARGRRSAGERALWVYLAFGIVTVLAAAAAGAPANSLLGLFVVSLVIVSYQRVLLAWHTMFALTLLVILFIPIRRYTVGANLPIELEPYRLVIALMFACWLAALAADPNVRWRKTGIEAPIAAVLLVMLLSMSLNIGRVTSHTDTVTKQFSFFLSYFLLVYFITSIMRRPRDLDIVISVLVGGGGIVALAALFEWKTGTNLFNWYSHVMPFLQFVNEGAAQVRGAGHRARASAQHPIALSAALVMLVPLAVYLYQRNRQKVWLVCGGLMTMGALSTGSRTGTTMLIALLVSFLSIRPRQTVRMLPMLLPLLVVIQVAMPGTLGTMKSMLNPAYMLKEQSYDKGSGAGRVADLGPALKQWGTKPLFGFGFGTRVADSNAAAGSENQILDDQWLGTLLEIGLFGVMAYLWLFTRSIRRLSRLAKSLDGVDAWLPTALAASLISFAVGMLTFDAFAFVQVTFFAFIMMGIGAAVINQHHDRRRALREHAARQLAEAQEREPLRLLVTR